jgi:hypothetical protein
MKLPLKSGSQAVARALASLLALQLAGVTAHGQAFPTSLTITVVQGEGAIGRVRERASQDPVVRVSDEKQNPLPGAAVVFTLPTEGATGSFANGAKTVTVMTDHEGIATAQGLRFNQIPGKVQMHVNVSYKGLTARTNILQVSEAPAGYQPKTGGGSKKVIIILAVLAAGGAGGAAVALRGSSNSTPSATPAAPTAIGITAGAGTLAPPR